jgi:transposase
MGKPYSDDLRERVVAAIEAGYTRKEVAELGPAGWGLSSFTVTETQK